MKKLSLLLITLIVIFFYTSCKDDSAKKPASTPGTTQQNCPCKDSVTLASVNPMPKDIALKIIGNGKNHKPIKTKDSTWTSFDPKELAAIVSQTGVIGVKFFIGAYPNDYLDARKRMYPVIILQLNMGKSLAADQFLYYEGTAVCPPPEDTCNCEKN